MILCVRLFMLELIERERALVSEWHILFRIKFYSSVETFIPEPWHSHVMARNWPD